MDITLTGIETHALRETLESVVSKLEKEIAGSRDPASRDDLAARKDVFHSILDKLPAGLIDVA